MKSQDRERSSAKKILGYQHWFGLIVMVATGYFVLKQQQNEELLGVLMNRNKEDIDMKVGAPKRCNDGTYYEKKAISCTYFFNRGRLVPAKFILIFSDSRLQCIYDADKPSDMVMYQQQFQQ